MSDASPPSLRLQLVGAARVAIGALPVAFGTRKALALLALLALDGPCNRARLAALLWPDQNEAGARRNLRREVFRLRNAGVPIDDDEAQSLTLATTVACDALEPGVGSGILLDGFDQLAGEGYAEWLANWRARLAQRGRHDTALAAAAHEKRGDWQAALALYLAALETDPTNESAAQHALRMHARLHDRNAALALFARLESELHRQLGLSPLPATYELVRQFGAAHDTTASAAAPTVPAPAPGPPPLPARAPFAGRGAEQQAVQAAWQAGRTVFICGPPGVGKSRLAAECAATVGAALFVNCHPDDAQLAYSSAVRALRTLFDAAPDLELPSWVLRELTRLLPELAPPAETGEAADQVGDEARMRLFEAYAQAWLLLAEENFNVIVLDDWQFADAASLQVWSFVDARRQATGAGSSAPLRRLFSFRSGELSPASLAHVRRQVDTGSATLLTLDGLAPIEVQSLIQRLAGQAGATLFAQRLHGATGGNPLFVLETIRLLFERQMLSVDLAGGWRTPFDAITSDYAELPVPSSVRETLLARVHALGADTARLLQAASLVGECIDLALLAGTAALDEAASVVALERAQASQILRVGDDGQVRFAHDLFRQCVADSLSPTRRALVHGRLARNMAAAGGEPAFIARHFEQARLDREAAQWFVHAGAEATRRLDLESALLHYSHALALGLDEAAAYAAHDHRMQLLHRLHRPEEQLRELSLMAALAGATDNPAAPYELASARAVTLLNSGRIADALAQARWVAEGAPTAVLKVRAHYQIGIALMFLGDDQGAVRELETALEQAPAVLPDWEPRICAFLCHLAVSGGAPDAAQRHYDRGMQAVTALDRPLTLAELLNAGCRIAEAAGDRALAVERLEQANALSLGVGDVTLRINFLFNLIVVLLNGGDAAAARVRRAEVMALLAGKTDAKARFIEQLSAGRLALHDGELGPAWQALCDACDAAVLAGDPSMQRTALVLQARLAADCGHSGMLEELLGTLAATGPHPPGRVVLVEEALQARLELAAGDAAAAVARLRRACASSTPRCADADWQENTEFARATLAMALAASGEHAEAHAALQGLRFGPHLLALAAEAGLAIEPADATALDTAQAWLADGRLTALEVARLTRALAAYHRRRGDTQRAGEARAACQRRIDTLTASVPDADTNGGRLRAALAALRPA